MSREPGRIGVHEAKDAGMALTLLCLIAGVTTRQWWLVWAAMGALVVDMTAPILFRPFAVAWFGASALVGTVTSRLLLSAVFFVVVTPVGLARRMLGKDPMRLRRWRRDRGSVFVRRDHLYTGRDIQRPY